MLKPQILEAIVVSLVSQYPMCRKLAAEQLMVLVDFYRQKSERHGLSAILDAFDALETRLNLSVVEVAQKVGRFDRWMMQLEQTIDGRGRMGSAVGASKEIRGGDNHFILEYCVGLP